MIDSDNSIRCIAVSPDGKLTAAAGPAGEIYLRRLSSGELLATLDSQLQTITAVRFLPGGDKLIACGSPDDSVADGDGLIEIWSLKANRCLQRFANSDNGCWDAAVSPDGKLIATGGAESSVNVWSSATGELVQTFTGHTAAVRAVAFAHDGSRLASAGTDSVVRVWDLKTGERISFYPGHTRTVLDLKLVSGDISGRVRLWQAAAEIPAFVQKNETSGEPNSSAAVTQ